MAPRRSRQTTPFFFVKLIPKKLRVPAVAALAGTGAILAAACFNKPQEETQPTPTSTTVVKVEPILDPRHFLELPFAGDLAMKIQQGWHGGIDYIKGEKLDYPDTWQSFGVLASADGQACANPSSRQGQAVFIKHKTASGTYYTYYGHLRSRIAGIPDCTGEYAGEVAVEAGQQIGIAGASGVDPVECNPAKKCIHLHFGVTAPGGLVDPYDLYKKREDYPDPNFTNGKTCGPNYLWVECPTGKSVKVTLTPTTRPTITVIPTPTPGNIQKGTALVLDGAGDEVEVADSESLQLHEAATIEARVRLNRVDGDGDGGDAVLAKGVTIEPYALWATFFKCDQRRPAAFFDGATWACGEVKLQSGVWYDLAVTYDKNQAVFYLDGQAIGVKSLIGGLTENHESLFLGQSPVPGKEDFAGEIDWVALWGRARTREEVAGDFEQGGPVRSTDDQDLVGFWQFNGDFSDSSSYHNDGRPLGDAHLENIQ